MRGNITHARFEGPGALPAATASHSVLLPLKKTVLPDRIELSTSPLPMGCAKAVVARAAPALFACRPMVRGIEPDILEGFDRANAVPGCSAGVLAGQHITPEIDGDVVRPVHAAFLTKRRGGPSLRDRAEEAFDLRTNCHHGHALAADGFPEDRLG